MCSRKRFAINMPRYFAPSGVSTLVRTAMSEVHRAIILTLRITIDGLSFLSIGIHFPCYGIEIPLKRISHLQHRPKRLLGHDLACHPDADPKCRWAYQKTLSTIDDSRRTRKEEGKHLKKDWTPS